MLDLRGPDVEVVAVARAVADRTSALLESRGLNRLANDSCEVELAVTDATMTFARAVGRFLGMARPDVEPVDV